MDRESGGEDGCAAGGLRHFDPGLRRPRTPGIPVTAGRGRRRLAGRVRHMAGNSRLNP